MIMSSMQIENRLISELIKSSINVKFGVTEINRCVLEGEEVFLRYTLYDL